MTQRQRVAEEASDIGPGLLDFTRLCLLCHKNRQESVKQQPCIRCPQRFLHSDSGNNPASDVRNADALSVNPGPRPGL